MILPPLRMVQKFKEENSREYKVIRPKLKVQSDQLNLSLRNRSNPKPVVYKPYVNEQKYSDNIVQKRFWNGYRAYSKAKSNIHPRPDPVHLKLQHNNVLVREFSVTPEFLNSIGSRYNDSPTDASETRQNPIKLAPKKKIFILKHKLPQKVMNNCLNTENRKVVLSKTPDPWKKHIHQAIAEERLSSDSDQEYIGNNY